MDASGIRLELLKMAKDLQMEEWNSKRQALENVYFQTRDIAMAVEYHQHVVEYPDLPPIPTSDDIVALASKLNEFVSRKG